MAFLSFPFVTNSIIYRNALQVSNVNPAYTTHKNPKNIKANNASGPKDIKANNASGNYQLGCTFTAAYFQHYRPPFSGQPLIQRGHRELLVVPIFCAKNSPEGADGEDEQDPQALEKLLKLYNAMKNKDVLELSEIITDEPECVGGNLSSVIQPLRGKKKLVDYFLNLIQHLGSEIEFFVKPTLFDGMKVGLQWGLEWNKTHTPFGKGFSFHISHHYKGKLVIKDAEMFMEPLRHIPFKLKRASNAIFKGGVSKVALCVLLLFITAAFLVSLMLTSS